MKFLVEAFYNWFRQALRQSKYRWVVVLGSLIYLISPLDISPDLFPIIGWIDDGIISTILLTEVSQLIIESRQRRQSSTETSANTETN